MRSRNGHTFKHWPQLCEEIAHAIKAHNAVIDGEIVCLDKRGRSNFKNLLFRRDWPYFYVFDLLAVDGGDLRESPLIERNRRLRQLIPSVPTRPMARHELFESRRGAKLTRRKGALLAL